MTGTEPELRLPPLRPTADMSAACLVFFAALSFLLFPPSPIVAASARCYGRVRHTVQGPAWGIKAEGSIFWPFNTILVDMSAARISSRSSACVSGRTSTARARTVHVTAAASTQGSGKASSNVVVLGASGYTGSEIVRLLHLHPHLKITGMTAEANAGRPFEEVYPQHVGLDLPLLVKTAVRPLHLPSCIVGANAWAAHYIPVSPHCACIVQPPIAIPLDALDIQDGGSLVTRFMARGQRQSVDRSDGRGATHAPRRLDHAWQGKGRPLPSSN
jgi:hypothetical protein